MGLCRREAHHIQGSLGTRDNPDKVKSTRGYLGNSAECVPGGAHHRFIRVIHQVDYATEKNRQVLGIVDSSLTAESVQQGHGSLGTRKANSFTD